jgi:phosphoribosyl-ATP pyrophosphohydrolase
MTAEERARDLAKRIGEYGCESNAEIVSAITAAIHAGSNAELERKREVESENARLRMIVRYQALQDSVGDWCCDKWGEDIKQRLRKMLEEAAECMVAHSDLKQLAAELGDVDLVRASILEALRRKSVEWGQTGQPWDQYELLSAAFERAKVKHGN